MLITRGNPRPEMPVEAGIPDHLQHLVFRISRKPSNTLGKHVSQIDTPLFDISTSQGPESDLGDLSVLPMEILLMITDQFDLGSTFAFRAVNRLAASIIHSNTEFMLVQQHARIVIRAALLTGAAKWITVDDVFQALISPKCSSCDDFASDLYLLTCKRVCYVCFTRNNSYLPISFPDAKKYYGLVQNQAIKLPHLTCFAGSYGPWDKLPKKRYIDRDSVIRAADQAEEARKDTGNDAATTQKVITADFRVTRSNKSGTAPTIRRRWNGLHDGLECNSERFLAIVELPWYDIVNQKLETGFHCGACLFPGHAMPLKTERKYLEESFEKHLREFQTDVRHSKLLIEIEGRKKDPDFMGLMLRHDPEHPYASIWHA